MRHESGTAQHIWRIYLDQKLFFVFKMLLKSLLTFKTIVNKVYADINFSQIKKATKQEIQSFVLSEIDPADVTKSNNSLSYLQCYVQILAKLYNNNIFDSVLIENSVNRGFDQKSENKKYPAWILQTFAETFADLFA